MKLSVLALDYRGNLSRWIAEVFGALAGDLKNCEAHCRGARAADVVDIANAVRSRYDLADGGPA